MDFSSVSAWSLMRQFSQDVEGVMQKKAYKVISIILKSSDSFVSLKFEELLGTMVEILHVIFLPNNIDLIAFISWLFMYRSQRITWSTGETFSLLKLYLLLKRYCHINCGKFLEVQF